MFDIIFSVLIIIYSLLILTFVIGMLRKFGRLSEDELPNISVVVAARNEENNIIDCLLSLNKLIYPENKIEIIIVNDHSTDNTKLLIENFIKDKPRFKTIIPTKQFKNIKGKANAIANAIEISKGDIILTTDADCIVSDTWAKTIASYFKENVGMVCGFTNQVDKTIFGGMQSMDFLYLLGIASGTINLGKPLSCIGNNMSYRKSVYYEVGTYEAIPFSVTEDFQLLMAFHNLKKYKIIYPLDKDALVTSKPCPNLKSLYAQKKRWGVGGMKSDIAGYFVMGTGFINHLLMVISPFFFTPITFSIVITKILIDFIFLFSIHTKLKLRMKIIHFFTFEIYYIIYVLGLPFALLFNRRVQWKDRVFE